MSTQTSTVPLLEKWFAEMDGNAPERVLDYITDDFQISVVFSTGGSVSRSFS